MDYFGIDSLTLPTSNLNETSSNDALKPFGFGCAEPGCKNKETNYGTCVLPYCDQNITCVKRNIEYLSLENARLKGEIGGMEFILSKFNDFNLTLTSSTTTSSTPMDSSP